MPWVFSFSLPSSSWSSYCGSVYIGTFTPSMWLAHLSEGSRELFLRFNDDDRSGDERGDDGGSGYVANTRSFYVIFCHGVNSFSHNENGQAPDEPSVTGYVQHCVPNVQVCIIILYLQCNWTVVINTNLSTSHPSLRQMVLKFPSLPTLHVFTLKHSWRSLLNKATNLHLNAC